MFVISGVFELPLYYWMEERASNLDTKHLYRAGGGEDDTKYDYQDEDNKFASLVRIYDEQERRKRTQLQNSNMLTNFKLKNEKEKEEKIDEKERSRRSRKDKEGRDYKCGCGKTYLSYPALYTHIKQKHESKEPEGTTRLNSNGPNKRGRPRRHRVEESLHSIEENPAKNEVARVLTEGINKDVMIVFDQFEETVQGKVFAEQNITFDKFQTEIEKIQRQQTKELSVRMPMDQVMAIYLYNMAEICNTRFFKYLEETLLCIRKCMNQNYKNLLRIYQRNSGIYTTEIISEVEDKGLEFSEVNNCEYLPLISDYFVLEFAPGNMEEIDQKVLTAVVHDFCYWLYDKKLTHLKISRYSVETNTTVQLGGLISS